MSSLSETTMSVLESAPPMSATAKVIIGVLILTMAAFSTHYASPMHLTRVLVAAIVNVETIYVETIEAGVLSKFDAGTAETLSMCATSDSPTLLSLTSSAQPPNQGVAYPRSEPPRFPVIL